jgi:ribosomal protein S27E
MVFAVQCPNPKCRKYQLVEEHDRNKVVHCLLCKTAIRIGGGGQGQAQAPSSSAHPPPSRPRS